MYPEACINCGRQWKNYNRMPILSTQDHTAPARATAEGNYLPALMVLALLYFMMGFITCLNDSLVPFFKTGFNLSYSQSSLVQFYFFLTYALVSIPAGKLVENIGYQRGMVTGFLIAAVGALLFLPASIFHVYALFLAALFILATGIVLLQVSANPYITLLGPVATASARLTLIQGVGSVGTTVAPVFGAAFILSSLERAHGSSEAVRLPYIGIALCLLVIAGVVWRLRLPKAVTRPAGTLVRSAETTVRAGIMSFRNLKFGVVGIFMYVGAEVSIGTFLTGYISDKVQAPVHIANNYVAFYWGGMLGGRFVGSFLLRRLQPRMLLTILSSGAIALIVISVSSGGYVAVWTRIATGVCNSVLFAIVFSLSVRGLGEYTTRASGLLSAAIAGGAILSFLEGVLKDHYSWTAAFMVPVGCYVYLIFFGVNGSREVRGSRQE
jgi:FHS family L-fucose permease-like MFS transporter